MASPAPLSNNPPPLRDRLAADHAGMVGHIDSIVKEGEELLASEIDDDDDATTVSDLIKKMAGYARRAEALRVDEKEPHLENGRVVDGFFSPLKKKVEDSAKALNRKLTGYLNDKADRERREREAIEAEQRRIAEAARQEAERQLRAAQEAEAAQKREESERTLTQALRADQQATFEEVKAIRATRAAMAAPADLARTRGASSLATLSRSWEFEVESFDKVPLDILRPHIPKAAIEQAIRSFVRAGGRELAGVRIYEDQKATVR